ncbi:SDR family NAD(P)-dependent oxidoreductase [Herbiconiux sp. CPCC 205763]|uniref:SDR family NAD(P)-dependent oxidoreductase n=1 Tax=Herbiconiux aconitum TaxID=2970913 RepID=A0ABT2GTY0_9MICO|nr:SDR family NAD(P)-dependent oxidoreductase [Herbiconiux aconitum]MCS5719586.1 SDR family NAD(P)-dependent oxidoreductase [Herbiconiux aconitum]
MSENEPRVVVVTGASSGIGAVAAARLAERGDRVVVVGRNPERTRAVAESIGGTAFVADFARFDEVRELASTLSERYDAIDVLLNNAGGLVSTRTDTVDGHEATIQSNYLSPYLLTRMLLPRLQESARRGGTARIVSTSSVANRFGRIDLADLDFTSRPWHGGWRAYGSAKLAVVLFVRELARRTAAHEGTPGVDGYSVHPGSVVTNFGSGSPLIRFGTAVTGGRWGATAEVGAAPLVALAADSPVPAVSGVYFDRLRANGAVARAADDPDLQRALWARTAEIVDLPD